MVCIYFKGKDIFAQSSSEKNYTPFWPALQQNVYLQPGPRVKQFQDEGMKLKGIGGNLLQYLAPPLSPSG